MDRQATEVGRIDEIDWHPEPELIAIADEARSREALREAGGLAWEAALRYLYGPAVERAMGRPTDYATLRATYFGPAGGPGPAPAGPVALAEVLDEFEARIAPHTLSAYHPASFGYFTPPPLVASVLGELLSQVLHQGIDVWHAGPVGAFVEEEVVRWLSDLVGYGEGSFGLLTSGGVMANFIGLAVARDVHLGRLRGRLPRGGDLEGVRVYASDQTHFSVGRALDELGFPPDTLVVIPSDEAFRLQAAPVADAVARDRARGKLPFAIAAVAGSTNTGSVDAVPDLAGVAGAEDLWLHVDAAYGGGARLSPHLADRVPGLDRADSVTVDPHKWLFQAYDVGGLVVRRREDLEVTFGGRLPEYYVGREDGHRDAEPLNFWRLGFEGTRRWRALKLWFSWKHLGTAGLARLVERNVELAEHLARRIGESDDFAALPPMPALSVVCFRHLPTAGRDGRESRDADDLDRHQERLQQALEASGDGWLSTTRLRGATYLRAGILNSQTTTADIDRLLDRLRELAGEL